MPSLSRYWQITAGVAVGTGTYWLACRWKRVNSKRCAIPYASEVNSRNALLLTSGVLGCLTMAETNVGKEICLASWGTLQAALRWVKSVQDSIVRQMGNDKLSSMFILWFLSNSWRRFNLFIEGGVEFINNSFSTKVILKSEDLRVLRKWLSAQDVSYDMSMQVATFTKKTGDSAANVCVASKAALKSHFKPGLRTSKGLEICVSLVTGEQVSLYFFDSPTPRNDSVRPPPLGLYGNPFISGGGRGGGRRHQNMQSKGYDGVDDVEEENRQSMRRSGPSTYILVPGRDMRPVEALMEAAYDLTNTTEMKKLTVLTASNQCDGWEETTMNKWARRLDSVILPKGQADELLADARKFISRRQWYIDRGLPYRRGYLLYGVPGGGKTSLVEAIAGELQAPVYWLSMSAPRMSDDYLMHMISLVEPESILLMEDIDVAFTKVDVNNNTGRENAVSAESGGRGGGGRGGGGGGYGFGGRQRGVVSGKLTFSGILNALDGITAAEGRLLYMTTNHKENLDPALIRPGRIDRQLEFKHTTRDQLQGMFEHFYSDFTTGDEIGEEGEEGRKENTSGLFGMLCSILGFEPSSSSSTTHYTASTIASASNVAMQTSLSEKEKKQLIFKKKRSRLKNSALKFSWVVTEGVHTAAEVLAYFQLHDSMEEALENASAWDATKRQLDGPNLDAERLRRLPPHSVSTAVGSREGEELSDFPVAFGRQQSVPLERAKPWS